LRTKNVQTIWYWETLREKRDTVKREAEDSTNLIGNDDKQRHGATISGCAHDVQAKTITLKFNRSLLGNDSVIVAPYGPPPAGKNGTAATITTSVRVLINASYWCRNSSISTTVPGAVGPKWCAGVCGSAPAPSGSNCTVPKCRTAIMCNDPGAPCGGSCGGRSVCGADDVVPTTDAQQQHRLGSKPSPAGPEPWIELDIKLGAAPVPPHGCEVPLLGGTAVGALGRRRRSARRRRHAARARGVLRVERGEKSYTVSNEASEEASKEAIKHCTELKPK